MSVKQLGQYKQKIKEILLTSSPIATLILGDYDPEIVGELLDKRIYEFLYVDKKIETYETYICIDTTIPKVHDTTKKMVITIWAFSNTAIMNYSLKGYHGTRPDILATLIEESLLKKENSTAFGIGALNLEKVSIFNPIEEYYGRVLEFSTSEFR